LNETVEGGRTLAGEDTKEKILDAAEELFSDNGFAATSIRAITTRAGVNLAALNYHFGSKDALIDAVFERRIGALNLERICLLDEVESKGAMSLEEVLRAFLSPPIRLAGDPARGGKVFMRLMGRAHTEPGDFFKEVIAKQFEEIFLRFGAAFRRVLPGLSPAELFWRMHFIVGAMAFTMSHKLTLRYMEKFQQEGEADLDDFMDPDAGVVLERLVGFAAAGLRADMSKLPEAGRN
jgi:AcrR family transcriptional regulator